MLPGFITLYRDLNGNVHLYFYQGYADNGKFYYNDLDLKKCTYKYHIQEYEDHAKEYIFESKLIKGMTCKLVNYLNNEEIIILKIK